MALYGKPVLIDAFRALLVNRNCPYTNEAVSIWRCISRNKLENLMQRLSVMILPATSERADRWGIVIKLTHLVAEKLKRYPVVSDNPMSLVMYERGKSIRRIFRQLVDVLAAGE